MVVVTHTVPEEWSNLEDSLFTFVTEGVPKAIDVAREIAGDKDVVVGSLASLNSAYNSDCSMQLSTSSRWCWEAEPGSSIL